MNPIERRLESEGFNSIAANFRIIMALAPPRLGAYRRILKDLDRALRKTPRSSWLHALKGKALSNMALYPQACAELRRSIALDGSCALSRAWLGEALLMENKVSWAEKEFDRALRLDPNCAWAYFFRSAARYIAGESARAGKDLRRILEMDRGGEAWGAASAFLSLIEAKQGRFEEAMSRIKQVLLLCSGRRWPYALRAALHRSRGDEKAALADMDAALAGRAEGWLYLERASINESLGRLEGALADVEAARKLQSGPSRAIFLRRGKLLLALKRHGPALRDFRRALRIGISPESRELGLQLVQALKEKGQRGAAVKALEELSRGLPRDRELRRVLAQTLGESDRGVEAIAAPAAPASPDQELSRLLKAFRRAVRLHDYGKAGRMGEAVLDKTRHLNHLQSLSVPFLPAHDGIPLSAAGQNSLRRALRKLERYLARHPRSPWGRYIRNQWRSALHEPQDEGDIRRLMSFPSSRYGWMRALAAHHLLYRRRFRDAIRQFEVARDFSQPPDWRCQCFIAEALVFQGDLSAALAAFRQAGKWAGEEIGQTMAWKAEVLLWVGRYGDALRILKAIPKAARSPYAYCWKGAALSKLGRLRPALAALDAAISRFPQDVEARVWRAETLLKAGRASEAEREAQTVLAGAGSGNYFARAIRGLARIAQGDAAGLKEDFTNIPVPVVRCARGGLGPGPLSEPEMAKTLRTMLRMGLGNRRMDVPLNPAALAWRRRGRSPRGAGPRPRLAVGRRARSQAEV